MKIAYYLNQGRQKNLYCQIIDDTEKVSFSLNQTIVEEEWDSSKERSLHTESYFTMLTNLNKYLLTKYSELKKTENQGVLKKLKTNVKTLIDGAGIESIPTKMGKQCSNQTVIPPVSHFELAFQRYSGLKKGEFRTIEKEEKVYFRTNENSIYTIDTYPGLTKRLTSLIDNRAYEQLHQTTDESIWNTVFEGVKVDKQTLLAKLQQELELFRQHLPHEERSKIDHLAPQKFLDNFNSFKTSYQGIKSCVSSACTFERPLLFPLIVLALMHYFNPAVFYEQYCAIEFSGEEWEGIVTDENEGEQPTLFFVKTVEQY
ncbi:hypothetical protein [Runella aurantiaca]|uniref:Arm DNA-binding domain-containing protein n=1 Tax=Runella aurantiaca TaxID=2282308 RepID=A0A369I593_9BACT|nr:hypothetical protein [Runella aurantiaca]RDB02364.1 hypothetical protein DVG78_29260 [Runella aurantiaca]